MLFFCHKRFMSPVKTKISDDSFSPPRSTNIFYWRLVTIVIKYNRKENVIMNDEVLWVPLKYPGVVNNAYKISEGGEVKDAYNDKHVEVYHSNNGYDYVLLNVDPIVRDNDIISYPSPVMLFRIDLLMATTFLKCDPELIGKPLDVIHINGDIKDYNVGNLKWVEDVEEWRDIVYGDIVKDQYQVSSHGNIRYKHNKEIIHQRLDRYGYKMVTLKLEHLTEGGYNSKPFKTHRLVSCMWYGDKTDDVNHINGVHHNNHYKNLEYITRKQNLDHAVKTQLREMVPIEQIEMIYDLLAKYTRPRLVYNQFIDHVKYPRISESLVKAVKRGFYDHRIDMTNRKPLKKMFTQSIHKMNLSVDEVDELRELIMKHNHSSTEAYKHLDHDKFPNVNIICLKGIKAGQKPYDVSNKFTKEELDKFTHTRSSYYKADPKAKFSPEKVDEIRELLNINGGSIAAVTKILNDKNITKFNVESIKRGFNKAPSNKYDLSFNDGKYPFIEK